MELWKEQRCFVYATATTLAPLLKYAIAATTTTNKTRHSVRGGIPSLTIGLLRVGTYALQQHLSRCQFNLSIHYPYTFLYSIIIIIIQWWRRYRVRVASVATLMTTDTRTAALDVILLCPARLHTSHIQWDNEFYVSTDVRPMTRRRGRSTQVFFR